MHNRMIRLGLTQTASDSTDESAKALSGANLRLRAGKARTGILLWLLGVPIPLILLFLLMRSCV